VWANSPTYDSEEEKASHLICIRADIISLIENRMKILLFLLSVLLPTLCVAQVELLSDDVQIRMARIDQTDIVLYTAFSYYVFWDMIVFMGCVVC